ncbi:MAG: hypothetical protein AAFX94_05155, partial [Myxococcota bacterium]
MERQRPDTSSNELDLYIRTYYSLLRSSGEVRVRSFEESHLYSDSSLHEGGRDSAVDIGAFSYAAGRMPVCLPDVQQILLGQSEEVFRSGGFDVRAWQRLTARGRRRPFRFDGEKRLAAFIASASDIDDMVPIVTAYQIEWNKLHAFLGPSDLGKRLADGEVREDDEDFREELSVALQTSVGDVARLLEAFGTQWQGSLQKLAAQRSDIRMQLLAGSFSDYQRAAQRWWSSLEPVYAEESQEERAPVYFVSSNTHSLVNLIGGYALAHRDEMLKTARDENPGGVWQELEHHESLHPDFLSNLLYFTLRHYVHFSEQRLADVQAWDAAAGIATVPDPGHVEVAAQVFDLSLLNPERIV